MSAGDGLRGLAADLRAVDVPKLVSPVLSKAGAQMRDRARQAAPQGPHLSPKGAMGGSGSGTYARSIIFDRPNQLTVDVGAMDVGFGSLSAMLEFGQGANAPHPHIIPQLEPEAETTAQWLGKVLGDAL